MGPQTATAAEVQITATNKAPARTQVTEIPRLLARSSPKVNTFNA